MDGGIKLGPNKKSIRTRIKIIEIKYTKINTISSGNLKMQTNKTIFLNASIMTAGTVQSWDVVWKLMQREYVAVLVEKLFHAARSCYRDWMQMSEQVYLLQRRTSVRRSSRGRRIWGRSNAVSKSCDSCRPSEGSRGSRGFWLTAQEHPRCGCSRPSTSHPAEWGQTQSTARGIVHPMGEWSAMLNRNLRGEEGVKILNRPINSTMA